MSPVAVHYTDSIVLMDDDAILLITYWIGDDGEPGCDPREACACVAGPDAEGLWYAIDLSDFEPLEAH